MSDDIQDSIPAGFSRYMTKPTDWEESKIAIEEVAEEHASSLEESPATQRGIALVGGLGNTISGSRFHGRNIGSVNRPVTSYILAKIRTCDGMPGLILRLANISTVNSFASARIADQHIHAHRRIWQRLSRRIHDTAQSNRNLLNIADTDEVYSHLVASKGWTSRYASDACGNTGTSSRYLVTKGKDQRVIASSAPAFHARLTAEWQRNTKSAGSSVSPTGNCRRQLKWGGDVDRSNHTSKAMRGAVVGIGAGCSESMLINRPRNRKLGCATVGIARRTIGQVCRAVFAAGDRMAIAPPCPSHRVAHVNIYFIG